ncbi:peptide deformylase [Thiotrichales bacterium 19S3-7]|nr:peptide deformylase [Thiotrichales bacterium 19S3-7]MCF6802532.1 peptide deformylase [Thiotrichales bacterium 19S3-11]
MEKILLMGNPLLYQQSEIITEIDDGIYDIINKLIITMKESKGVGIAAPQIGILKRIIIFGFGDNSRYPNEEIIPITPLINPEFKPLSDETEIGIEGCLSVPELRAPVSRYTKIKYQGLDQHGNHINDIATGFKARIIQHEIDHLNGILFPLRVDEMRSMYFEQSTLSK